MNTLNQTPVKKITASNLEQATLAVARCELNNLADCTSPGLSVGVSHIGGESRHSVVTIHKVASDNSYAVPVMNVRIDWDSANVIEQFKHAILAARKVICDHNKSLKVGGEHRELPAIGQSAPQRPAKSTFTVKVAWSGFSRGYSIYEVEAVTELEATEYYGDGRLLERHVEHDNTQQQSSTITGVINKAA